MANSSAEGEGCAFNLACVAEALDTVKELAGRNTGWEHVETRLGEYKNWDPDIFKVDKDTENGYRRRLEGLKRPIVFLSEEVGHVELNPDASGPKQFVILVVRWQPPARAYKG